MYTLHKSPLILKNALEDNGARSFVLSDIVHDIKNAVFFLFNGEFQSAERENFIARVFVSTNQGNK